MYRNEALNLLTINLISYYGYEEFMDIYGIFTMIGVKYDGNISSFRSTNHDVLPVPCRSLGQGDRGQRREIAQEDRREDTVCGSSDV